MSDGRLHSVLTDVAAGVRVVDLYERALARSHQISRRRGAAAAAAAVLIVVGVTWQSLSGGSAAPPLPASPSVGASATPDPQASPDADEMLGFSNATLTLPEWPAEPGVGPCPAGPIRFDRGVHGGADATVIVSVGGSVSGDVAGAAAYAAVFSCSGPADDQVQQVVAYRQSGGEFTLLGKVVDTAAPGAGEGTEVWIGTITSAGGALNVEVGVQTGSGAAAPQYATVGQHRTYSWNGSGFVQTAGPGSFIANPDVADVSATASRLVFQPPAQGCRTGTVTLTISNHGPEPARDVTAVLILGDLPHPKECQVPPNQGYASVLVPVGALAAGQSREVTLAVLAGPDERPPLQATPLNFVELRAGDQRYIRTTPIVIQYETS